MATADAENYSMIDITGATNAASIRQRIFQKLRVPNAEYNYYGIFRTELGEAALGDPVTDDQLMLYCEAWADSTVGLKFLVRRTAPDSPSPHLPVFKLPPYALPYDQPAETNAAISISERDRHSIQRQRVSSGYEGDADGRSRRSLSAAPINTNAGQRRALPASGSVADPIFSTTSLQASRSPPPPITLSPPVTDTTSRHRVFSTSSSDPGFSPTSLNFHPPSVPVGASIQPERLLGSQTYGALDGRVLANKASPNAPSPDQTPQSKSSPWNVSPRPLARYDTTGSASEHLTGLYPIPQSATSVGHSARPTIKWVEGEKIHDGTYTKIFLAMDVTTGGMLAVKQAEMPRTIDGPKDARQVSIVDALKAEQKTLEALDHPNIVQYLGFEQTTEFFSVFLEFVPTGSIGSCLHEHGKFAEDTIKSFTGMIAAGLAYLHGNKIIHRYQGRQHPG